MIWNEKFQNHDLLNFYKKMITIRKKHPTFVHGDFKEISGENNIMSYSREYNNEKYIIIINNNDHSEYID